MSDIDNRTIAKGLFAVGFAGFALHTMLRGRKEAWTKTPIAADTMDDELLALYGGASVAPEKPSAEGNNANTPLQGNQAPVDRNELDDLFSDTKEVTWKPTIKPADPIGSVMRSSEPPGMAQRGSAPYNPPPSLNDRPFSHQHASANPHSLPPPRRDTRYSGGPAAPQPFSNPSAGSALALPPTSRPALPGALPMPLPFHAQGAGGGPSAHSMRMHQQQQHYNAYGGGSNAPIRTQFVIAEEGSYRAKALQTGPQGAFAGAHVAPRSAPNYRVRTDLNDPELAQFPSKAGPKDWIKLPGQRGVPPEEYQEFLDLGMGDIFDLDLDRVLDKDRKWTLPDADLGDFFNFDLTPETWAEYCRGIRRFRAEFRLNLPILCYEKALLRDKSVNTNKGKEVGLGLEKCFLRDSDPRLGRTMDRDCHWVLVGGGEGGQGRWVTHGEEEERRREEARREREKEREREKARREGAPTEAPRHGTPKEREDRGREREKSREEKDTPRADRERERSERTDREAPKRDRSRSRERRERPDREPRDLRDRERDRERERERDRGRGFHPGPPPHHMAGPPGGFHGPAFNPMMPFARMGMGMPPMMMMNPMMMGRGMGMMGPGAPHPPMGRRERSRSPPRRGEGRRRSRSRSPRRR